MISTHSDTRSGLTGSHLFAASSCLRLFSLLLVFGLSLACKSAAVPFSARPTQPNIIFIVVDNLGYGDLGVYGSRAIKTPNLDRMAAEGLRFTQAYSGAPICAPSRSALMTGMHGGHNSVRDNVGSIPLLDEDVTIAEVLRDAGYTTGGFGKWGLGDIQTSGAAEMQGFGEFYGYYHHRHAHNYFPTYLIRNGKKFSVPANKHGRRGAFSHYLIFEETLRFIRANRNRPFFCYAAWTPPHALYKLPPEDPAWGDFPDKPWPPEARGHAAYVAMLDRNVGELLDLLSGIGLDENTLVFFTSDNGAASDFPGSLDSAGPFRGHMRDLYEGGIRIPSIARWPGQIEQGTTSDHPFFFPDVMPTLAELAGASKYLPAYIDGTSFAPTLFGADQQSPDFLYWEASPFVDNFLERNPDHPKVRRDLSQAVRVNNWKLIRGGSQHPWELYDLSVDPGESSDLASHHPKIVEKLGRYAQDAHVPARPQIRSSTPEGRKYR